MAGSVSFIFDTLRCILGLVDINIYFGAEELCAILTPVRAFQSHFCRSQENYDHERMP